MTFSQGSGTFRYYGTLLRRDQALAMVVEAPDFQSGVRRLSTPRSEKSLLRGLQPWSPLCRFAARAAKADDTSLKLQNEFYGRSHCPLDTRSKWNHGIGACSPRCLDIESSMIMLPK